MSEELRQLKLFIEAANRSNSSNAKLEVIRQFPQCQKLWKYAYDKINYRYGLKSKNIIKNIDKLSGDLSFGTQYNDIYSLLEALNKREITGHTAIKAVLSFIDRNSDYRDIVYNILDRNLKTRTDAKLFNKAFPKCIDVFDVALAEDIENYDPNKRKVDFQKDHWYASRKLDGCRNVCRINNTGNIKFTSRGGLDFLNFGVLKQELEKFNLSSIALDGEVCLIDEQGNEDFQRIMKVIRKKNYTIPNPRYCIFDLLPLQDFEDGYSPLLFEERQANLQQLMNSFGSSNCLARVSQTRVTSWEHLQQLKDAAVAANWEGLIIRKNCVYESDRSNNMLKVKVFIDAEFIVEDVEMGPIRYIAYTPEGISYEKEDVMLSAIMIRFKDNIVRVGSGFSLAERQQYFSNPNDLIGKQVTVKYFQETVDENGKPSLRFPTLKYIWEDGDRDEVE